MGLRYLANTRTGPTVRGGRKATTMAVTVRHLPEDINSPASTTYDEGTSFDIKDGHLIVTGWDGGTTYVAVFAPGKWIKAHVHEKK